MVMMMAAVEREQRKEERCEAYPPPESPDMKTSLVVAVRYT